MTHEVILIAQSVTSAVITIIGLLLVAGIIGYLTAWFYAKSVYVPVIKGLQVDKEQLTNQVESLNRQVDLLNKQVEDHKSEISKLNVTLEEKNSRIATLEREAAEMDSELKKIMKPVKQA
jgi:septal ring factor EnvC (AmiA/AmiB activator)